MKSDASNIINGPGIQSAVLNSIPQMLCIVDSKNRILWHNRKTTTFFGKQISGELFKNIYSIDPDKLTSPTLKPLSIVQDKKGNSRVLEHTIKKHQDRKNSLVYKIITTDDITGNAGSGRLPGLMTEFESILSRFALESINIPGDEIDIHMNRILQLAGKFSNVNRCFIALNTEGKMNIRVKNEWHTPGYAPDIMSINWDTIPKNLYKKKKDGVIIVPDAQRIKNFLLRRDDHIDNCEQNIAMLFPLISKSKQIGYIGFITSGSIRAITPEIVLIFRISAELAVNLFERKDTCDRMLIGEKIISKSSGMLAFFDRNGVIRLTNEAFRKFHSLKENEAEQKKIISLFSERPGYSDTKFVEYINRSLKGEEIRTEIWYKNRDSLRLLDISLHPNVDNDGIIRTVILNSIDITERVQLEAKILEVIHKERKKIGISLHDDLSHDLLVVAIKSRLLADSLKPLSFDMSKEASEIEQGVKNAINEVRRLSHGLIPYKNSGLEFKEMIDGVALTIERDYRLNCEFYIDKNIHITDESVIKELYYIIDESVTNAIKHSGCTEIKIAMTIKKQMISLNIIDNGCGISGTYSADSGVGLEIMKYRARSIGGFLEAKDNPGGGTIVECIFNPEKLNS